MKKYNIYGVGNALVDFEYEVDASLFEEQAIDKGLMTLIDEERHNALLERLSSISSHKASGGSAANTIIAAAQLGACLLYTSDAADE